jgi:hypothetical protein
VNMQDNAPSAKVTAAGIAGTAVTAVIYGLNLYVPFFKTTPIDAALAAMLTTLAASAAAYLTTPSKGDVAVVKP